MKLPVYAVLARTMGAYARCVESGNGEWEERHLARMKAIKLPHGSGFDSGTQLDTKRSTERVLYFYTSFHHMTDTGYYDGWTEHTVTVRGNLAFGFTMTISGRDRNGIKDYIAEVFDTFLREEIEEYPTGALPLESER